MYRQNSFGLIVRLSDGATIPNDDGNEDRKEYLRWVSAGNVPAPVPLEEIAGVERAKRDFLLKSSDVHVLPDRWLLMTDSERQVWASYRQALRDIPQQIGFPAEISWPEPPQ